MTPSWRRRNWWTRRWPKTTPRTRTWRSTRNSTEKSRDRGPLSPLPSGHKGSPMSDRKALLRGVIDEPDDDTPRLVMADWFEENGESDRAEFIRLQIQLAREDVEQADEPLP